MSEIADPYGTPCSEAPVDTSSPPNLTATKLVESSSQSSASYEKSATLRRKIVELEEEKECLALSAADAVKRAKEAEKRTAAAEAETAAAKQRAQERHTEKIHANNAVRHLKAELEKQVEERRSYLIKAKACFDGLKTRIFELQCGNKDQEVKNSEKIQSLEAQLNEMQSSLLSSEEEQARFKTQSDTIIKDLNKVIVGRQSAYKAAEKAQASLKDELEQSKAQLEQQEAEAEAHEAILRESNQKLRKSESNWKLKFEDMQKRVGVLEKHIQAAQQQTKGAQQQAQSAQQQFNTAKQQLAAAKQQILAAYQQVEAVKQQANLALAGAQQQYLMAVRTMRQNPTLGMFPQPQQQPHQQPQLQPQAQFQVQPQPQQHSQSQFQHQSRFLPLAQLLPKPQPQLQPQLPNPPQQTTNPNKKRKLDSDSGADFLPNGFQPTGNTQVLNTNPNPTSQTMAPNGGNAQFPSTAPVRQMPLAQYCSQSRITPMQQYIVPKQSASSMKPQQPPYMQAPGLNNMTNNTVSNNMVSNSATKSQPSPYPQGTNLSNIESLLQNNVSNPQDMSMNFNFDFSQVIIPELNMDELVAMSKANSAHTTSLPNTQVNDPASGFGDSAIVDFNTTEIPDEDLFNKCFDINGVITDPNTTEPQDNDLFKDLFDNNLLALFEDPDETPSQDQA